MAAPPALRSGATNGSRREPARRRRGLVVGIVVAVVAIGVAVALATFRGDGSAGASAARDRSGHDIILVTIDTLRADALGYAGNPDVATPFLDRLASEGVVFTNAHAHSVVTLPSHTNILTGLLPYQHGIRDNSGFVLDEKYETVAHRLRDEGWATGAFVAAFPLDRRFGLDRGFDVYDDKYPEGSAPTQFITPERSAPDVLAPAVQWFEANRGRSRFLWVHVYDPHAPYAPPPPFRDRHPDAPYLGEVEAADAALAEYLAPLLERTPDAMVIVTADHGEALGEHGEESHGFFAYEETLEVPLIVWEKDRLEPRADDRYVRHIDIAPTILARAGIAVPEELPGAPLFEGNQSRDTYFESMSPSLNNGWAPLIGMIHDGHKYIDLPIPELYDLASDPDEEKNIVRDNRRMTFAIRELLRGAAPKAAETERNLSEEESARLLSLGYVTGDASKKEYTEADDLKVVLPYHLALNEVVSKYQEGDVDAAIARARKLLAERPDMDAAKTMLSFLLQDAENPEEAIAVLQDEVRSGRASEAMRRRLGLVLSETGRAAEAVAVLKEFAGADDPDLLNAYGIALADVGRTAEAVAQFRRALELDPTNATAYENLGVVALRANDVPRARQYLSKALELNPQMPLALNTMGVVYARTGDSQRAIDAWARSVTLDPKQYDALYNLSVVAGRAGRPEIARRALAQFIQTAPPERYGADIEAARKMLAQLEREAS
ncbi:MAG: sulfatase-like hydrolase/transferase [Thermoanaerobaculia bacterium]